jgi:hypothetical protein
MDKIIINLDGKPTDVVRQSIPLNKIILDVQNPRIQYYLDTRLHDEVNQDKIKFALAEGNEQYPRLKEHIERNGGIYNPIWVTPKDDYFLVIEGNTRAYIYEELSEKYVHDDRWKTIDSYTLPEKVEKHKINFIRLEAHLFGQTPWDAYEKARELYRLHTEEDYSLKRLEQLTKMSAFDIRNNIQAFKDMEEQYLTKYDSPIERLKFSYFVEFRKNKELKKLVKDGKLILVDFCEWVGQGKFGRGEDVRKLSLVLKDDEARQALIEDDFQAALDQLEQKNPSAKSKLFEKIEDVISGLENMHFSEYDEIKRGLQPAKVESLKRLYEVVSNFLKSIGNF